MVYRVILALAVSTVTFRWHCAGADSQSALLGFLVRPGSILPSCRRFYASLFISASVFFAVDVVASSAAATDVAEPTWLATIATH